MLCRLEWFRCFGDKWCDLFEIDLDHSHFDGRTGVYVIWYGDKKPTVLKVGQGILRDCLNEDKKDYVLAAYRQYGLYVTWAKVMEYDCAGVEKYLGEVLKPVVGNRLPDVHPIRVNLPWEESVVFAKK